MGSTNTSVPCPGLRAAIDAAGLSVKAAAAKLRWRRSRVATWISQGHAPEAPLEQLAKALGVPLAQITAAREETPAADALRRLAGAAVEIEAMRQRLEVVAAELRAAHGVLAKASAEP